MIPHHGVQGRFGLVVGRVRFKHQSGLIGDESRKRRRSRSVVVLHRAVVEINARLHDHCDHAPPSPAQCVRGEGAAVHLESQGGSLGPGNRDPATEGGFAARHRHLGADHVDRRRQTRRLRGGLGHLGEYGRPLRDHLVGERGRIVSARHAAVQMDLVETRGDVGADQLARTGHGHRGRQVLPGVWPQVVATEQKALRRQTVRLRHCLNRGVELPWRHAGVAAELVYLIGGGFDQQQRARLFR